MCFHSIRILPLICLAASLSGSCQSPTTLSLPDDPAAIMTLAGDKNGLDSAVVRPWHIRASFTIYDANGKPEDSGAYEEWWVSPNQYKRSFTSGKATQTDYATPGGLFREGAQDWLPEAEDIRMDLIEPIPRLTAGDFNLKKFSESEKGGKLKCVQLFYPIRGDLIVPKDFYPSYCFESGYPALRTSSLGSYSTTVYNQIVVFQGHFLAREIHVSEMRKPALDLTVDAMEGLAAAPDRLLSVPADAKPVPLETISFGKNGPRFGIRMLLKKPVPEYPMPEKIAGIQGTVIFVATIEKDGHLDKISLVSGPVRLQKSALDAVSKWVYRPLVVMGEPRAVEVKINVIFNVG